MFLGVGGPGPDWNVGAGVLAFAAACVAMAAGMAATVAGFVMMVREELGAAQPFARTARPTSDRANTR
jgi:hypothetical protein